MRRVVWVLMGLVCFNGCALVVLPGLDVPQGPLVEQVVEPAAMALFPKKILILDIDGPITDESTRSLFGSRENTVQAVKEKLKCAREDDAVVGVVVRINSPGGGVTASDIIYRELVAFKEQTGKVLVACLMDVAASGGYYVALAADQIVAHPTTITGSVGVVAHFINVDGLFNKIGLQSQTIKSGKMKDIGSILRPMTGEEKKLFQRIIDQMQDRFLGLVKTGREQITPAHLKMLSEGVVFTGEDAEKVGFVDKVGYLSDAIELVKQETGIKKADIVIYRKRFGYRGNIYAQLAQGDGGDVNLLKIDAGGFSLLQRHPVFLYLWEGSP